MHRNAQERSHQSVRILVGICTSFIFCVTWLCKRSQTANSPSMDGHQSADYTTQGFFRLILNTSCRLIRIRHQFGSSMFAEMRQSCYERTSDHFGSSIPYYYNTVIDPSFITQCPSWWSSVICKKGDLDRSECVVALTKYLNKPVMIRTTQLTSLVTTSNFKYFLRINKEENGKHETQLNEELKNPCICIHVLLMVCMGEPHSFCIDFVHKQKMMGNEWRSFTGDSVLHNSFYAIY